MFPFPIPSIDEVENKQKELRQPRLLPTPSASLPSSSSSSSSLSFPAPPTTTTLSSSSSSQLPTTSLTTVHNAHSLSTGSSSSTVVNRPPPTNTLLSCPPPSLSTIPNNNNNTTTNYNNYNPTINQPIPPLTKLSSSSSSSSSSTSTTINIPKPLPSNQPLVLRTGPDVQRYADSTNLQYDYVKDTYGPLMSILGTTTAGSSHSTVAVPTNKTTTTISSSLIPPIHSSSSSSSSLLSASSSHGLLGFTNQSFPSSTLTATNNSDTSTPQQKVLQPLQAEKSNLFVNPKQKGNPVLNYIKNVWWTYVTMEPGGPDFMMGSGTVALYLSLKYHLLHADYVQKRIRSLKKDYRLRLLILLIDVEDCEKSLNELTRITLLGDVTLICCSSIVEAARYLETYKAYENKSAKAIQERVEETFLPRVQEVLTTIRSINKVDVIQLLAYFGSLQKIMVSSIGDLQEPPGIGDKKAKRLFETFTAPFDHQKSRNNNNDGKSNSKIPTVIDGKELNNGNETMTTGSKQKKVITVATTTTILPSSTTSTVSRPKLTITEAFRVVGASVQAKRASSLLEEKNISIDLIDIDDNDEDAIDSKALIIKEKEQKGEYADNNNNGEQKVDDDDEEEKTEYGGGNENSTMITSASTTHPSKRSKSDHNNDNTSDSDNTTKKSDSLLLPKQPKQKISNVIEIEDSSQENEEDNG